MSYCQNDRIENVLIIQCYIQDCKSIHLTQTLLGNNIHDNITFCIILMNSLNLMWAIHAYSNRWTRLDVKSMPLQ